MIKSNNEYEQLKHDLKLFVKGEQLLLVPSPHITNNFNGYLP